MQEPEPKWLFDKPEEITPELESMRVAFLTGYREGLIRAFTIYSASFGEILKVVDEQAHDEGLWFGATTVPEAYLQQELRRLHGIIEFEVAE